MAERRRAAGVWLFSFRRRRRGLPPLDSEAVLWVAALDRVPIRERVEWVAVMKRQVDEINAERARG